MLPKDSEQRRNTLWLYGVVGTLVLIYLCLVLAGGAPHGPFYRL